MLLVPLLLALALPIGPNKQHEATPYIDTPKECSNIHADIYCCYALVQFYEFARFRVAKYKA